MSRLRYHIPRNAWWDALFLSLFVVAVNWLVDRRDIGMFDVNPSPYLLIPIAMGARYGFTAGLGGGALATFLVLIGIMFFQENTEIVFFDDYPYFVASMFLVGALTGEIQLYFNRKLVAYKAERDDLSARVKALNQDVKFLREAKDDLDRRLATRDNDTFSLDSESRRLFAYKPEDIYFGVLLLLNRQVRVHEGACYQLNREGTLIRKALLGKNEVLTDTIDPRELEMVQVAIDRNALISIREFSESRWEHHHDILIVVPLIGSSGNADGVIVITGMPFISFNRKSLRLISIISKWASQVIEIKLGDNLDFRLVENFDDKRIYFEGFFRNCVELSFDSYKHHNVPSSIILFWLSDIQENYQEWLEKKLMTVFRAGDYACHIHMPAPNIAVLLPLTGPRGASIFADRCLEQLRSDSQMSGIVCHQTVSFDNYHSFEELWAGMRDVSRTKPE